LSPDQTFITRIAV